MLSQAEPRFLSGGGGRSNHMWQQVSAEPFNTSATVEGPPGGEFHIEEGFVFLYAAGISNLFEVPGAELPDVGISFIYYNFFPSAGVTTNGWAFTVGFKLMAELALRKREAIVAVR